MRSKLPSGADRGHPLPQMAGSRQSEPGSILIVSHQVGRRSSGPASWRTQGFPQGILRRVIPPGGEPADSSEAQIRSVGLEAVRTNDNILLVARGAGNPLNAAEPHEVLHVIAVGPEGVEHVV